MPNKSRGFTVVELLVVIAVLGVVVVMTVSLGPRLGQSSRLNKTVNEVVSNINLAKQLASSENRFVALDFSSDGTYYQVKRQRDVSYFSTSLTDTFSWEVVKTVRPMDGEQFFKDDGTAGAIDFAVSSIGAVRKIFDPNPAEITLNFFIKKSKYATASPDNIVFSRKVVIYPYGGVKIDK